MKNTLESAVVFLDAHDWLAMLVSALNLAAFAIAVRFGLSTLSREGSAADSAAAAVLQAIAPPAANARRPSAAEPEDAAASDGYARTPSSSRC